jgi:dihydrofolate synthase/folylpolyglutamate synthase
MAASPRRSAAASYLAARTRLGIKFGLETMRALMDDLGRPQLSYPVLLVAGTNGKGSVAAYADAGLRAAGLRCGRYTSPHLVRLHERITVGGREISAAALEAAVGKVRRSAERLLRAGRIAAHPTFFEAVTAAAFVHFRDRGVEAAVVEVGMGARLDATNVTEPLASAIVTIALDHEAYLGGSLGEIAREKAGVLRRGRVTVLGGMDTDAEIAVRREALRVGAVCIDAFEGVTASGDARASSVVTPRGRYVVGTLAGAHQRDNAVVALRLLEEAKAAGLRFDVVRAADGFERAAWPGRLQRIPGRPALLLDGAHNPAGAFALAEALRAEPPFVLLFGAMEDKDVAVVGRALFPLALAVVVTRAPDARGATPADVIARVGPVGPPVYAEADVARALAAARRIAGRMGLVVVAGSLYLVGDVLRRQGSAVTRTRTKVKAATPRRGGGARRRASSPAPGRRPRRAPKRR